MTVLTCGWCSGAEPGCRHRRHAPWATTIGLLAGLGCFVGAKSRWVVLPIVLAAGRAGRDVVGGVRSRPRSRPAEAAGAGCLRPGAVACGSMARLSTDKAPIIAPPDSARPRRPTDGRRRESLQGHETVALSAGTGVLCLAGRLGLNGVRWRRDRSQCLSSHPYAVQTF